MKLSLVILEFEKTFFSRKLFAIFSHKLYHSFQHPSNFSMTIIFSESNDLFYLLLLFIREKFKIIIQKSLCSFLLIILVSQTNQLLDYSEIFFNI